jgi:two-component system NarL family response regulator
MLVAQGFTYPQVGESLHLSEPTIRYHMGQMMERLHLDNRAQVIAYAGRHGLAQRDPP